MTILCHVSDKKLDVLSPQPPENAICFSEDVFISYFGEYLYLFDLNKIRCKFGLVKQKTEGLFSIHEINHRSTSIGKIYYRSKPLKDEWRCFEPIDVKKYAIGVLEHWNHTEGVIGKHTINGKMTEVAVNLMKLDMDALLRL